MSMARISLNELNSQNRTLFVSHLGWIYEHSSWVADMASDLRPFKTIADLHSAMDGIVQNATLEKRIALLQAHPDLAGRLAQAGDLTPASVAEQSAAGLTRLAPDQVNEIQQRNAAYFNKFGFPFIVCARLNNLETILSGLSLRIENDRETEIDTAIGEISKIASLRLRDAIKNE
jgi:2-oxo-4-hydroxy-4-carboxy-5-ureidoimidazoline decarboxylase